MLHPYFVGYAANLPAFAPVAYLPVKTLPRLPIWVPIVEKSCVEPAKYATKISIRAKINRYLKTSSVIISVLVIVFAVPGL